MPRCSVKLICFSTCFILRSISQLIVFHRNRLLVSCRSEKCSMHRSCNINFPKVAKVPLVYTYLDIPNYPYRVLNLRILLSKPELTFSFFLPVRRLLHWTIFCFFSFIGTLTVHDCGQIIIIFPFYQKLKTNFSKAKNQILLRKASNWISGLKGLAFQKSLLVCSLECFGTSINEKN